jgi:DNA-binding NarL/FixJ family response regulator
MIAAKILVVDDDAFVRTTLSASFLSYRIQVVAAVGSASEALDALSSGEIEVAVLDLDLGPGPSGIDIAYSLRKAKPDLGLVLLTSYSDPRIADPSSLPMPKGCRFVTKTNLGDFKILVAAVLGARMQPLSAPHITGEHEFQLTATQLEVLKLVAEGLSNSEIAVVRKVSVKAIDGIIAKIYLELNLEKSSRTNQRVQMVRAFFALSGKKAPGA